MLKIKNLSKSFGDKKVIKNLNVNFHKGLNFILGPSGSGKSTLLKIISGMDKEYEGLITYKGKELKSFSEKDMNSYYFNSIGFVWQNFGLIEHLSVEDNVKMVLNLTKDSEEVINEKVNLILKRIGMSKLAKEKIATLSGGQKQRVAIARVLVKEPEVIIADEPTGALDKGSSKIIMSVLKKISKERLVIIVTHDKSLIEEEANVYKLENGQLNKVQEFLSSDKAKDKNDYINPILSVKNAIFLSIKNFKGLLFKRVLVSLVLTLSAFFMLLNLSGDVVSKQDEILNKLIVEKGNQLREISLPVNAISAGELSEDDNGGTGGNVNISQDPSKVLEKYANDERIEYIIPMGYINDMKVQIQGNSKTYSVENTGTSTVFNDLIKGDLPQLKGREVAVTNAFLKNNNLKPEDVIGKTISIKGSSFDWSTGTPKSITIALDDLKIVGVTDSSTTFSMPNGEKISQEFEDSFVYSVDILREIKEKSNNKEDGVSFSIRVKEVKDIMPVVEELNKEGLIPIGEFESVKDILKISDISKEGAKSITIIIAVLGVAITFVITIITANLRKYEFAVLKINGYTKASLFTLNIAEGILISLVSIILFGIIYTPINTLSLKFFNVVLSGGTTIVKGIVLVFLLGVISSIISYFIVYADEVIKLDDNKIVTVKENTENIKKNSENKKEEKWKNQSINKNTINKLSIKNFKLNFVKYILAAIIIAFSTATFIASFSANEIGNKVFNDFKEKNSFYNIGQVPKYFNGEIVNEDLKSLKDQLSEFDEIENVYYQYDIKDVSIKLNDKEIEVPIKSATALANESLSYGRMPRGGKNEIAISASIVNRMVKNIQDIIGKKCYLSI